MKRQIDLTDWLTVVGTGLLEFEEPAASLSGVAEDASLFVQAEGRDVLVWSGRGRFDLELRVGVPFGLMVRQPEGAATSFARLADRGLGFVADDASFTVLEAMTAPVLSAEVRAVMDRMNRAAIAREQAMLRALRGRSA